ncbi:SurA N-terminal domain-containing protein [Cytobacillus sp. FJAT-54145]|uniref:SurA N-terminal domain-containing protein n=1 Tax=Cytobacillus spartinae TaxID=3299023 RepID=A0ABW6K9C6_9BACI
MFKRIFTGFLLVASCLLVLAACSNNPSDEGAGSDEEVVASVNGKEIYLSEYNLAVDQTKKNYVQQGMDESSFNDEMLDELEKNVMDQLINTELFTQQAQNAGIEVEEEAVDAQLNQLKGQFSDESQYKEALEANNLTESSLKGDIKQDLLVSQYVESNIGTQTASEEEVQARYEMVKEMAKSQEQEVQELEEIRAQLEQEVVAQKQQVEVEKLIEELRDTNKIEIYL